MKQRQKRTTRPIVSALQRIDTDLDAQLERMGQMQRDLDVESRRLALLAAQAEAHRARIDALLQTAP